MSASAMMSSLGPVGRYQTRLFALSNDQVTSSRQVLLQEALKRLGIDSEGLMDASLQSIQSPTAGYDGRFGKSAIKTYRAFLFPKEESIDELRLPAAADRCARQIDFLLKRHRSHETEWVRHHDAPSTRQVFPLVLLLDNLRSAFNVGSIFRTADAAGCTQVLTTGLTPHPRGSGAEKLRKSALGAEMVVPSRHFESTREALDWIRSELPDYRVYGMETTGRSVLYSSVDYPKDGVVLVLGNEVTGVDTELIPDLDGVVEIPMFGEKNSLNVAACAPVVLYEIIRQWDGYRGGS